MVMMGEMLNLGSTMGTLMLIYTLFKQFFPRHLQLYFEKYFRKSVSFIYPYVEITFDEFTGEFLQKSEAYLAIKSYLGDKSAASAKRLKANVVKDTQNVVLSMDYNEEVTDEFQGVTVWWSVNRTLPSTKRISWFPDDDEKRSYTLTVHKRHREIITQSYISHVLKEGKETATRNRRRKLYSNNPSKDWHGYRRSKWSNVPFEHPATFDTLAMDSNLKEEIKNDLIKFSTAKDYYVRIGKAWKRGYLLYGPPGTGKSSMIAAMANLLDYDVYDLELTAVKENAELRRLLIDTSNKSIVVIEDIDCSLDLTGQREKKKAENEGKDDDLSDPITKKTKEDEKKESKVTLSGLLNCIDGLWSSCGGERIIVFTTNYVEKLDPALIRRGRMDKYIELSYCCFDAFKVFAKNYLEIDSHSLFGEIETLLGDTDMTPADVAENLMPKSNYDEVETCLKRLIEAIKDAKKKKAEDEARLMAEKEEKKKQKSGEEDKEESVKEVKENGMALAANEVKENGVTVSH
ncbi:putative ATP binding protein [Hibiscus syriacus]|uniref:ATP binding protein n=1 Tax=Hibiscus syriacus TaxID=106335 RepID=A0A6A2YSV1_HIBSY|nr:AAA-ATPase ASD, mitochondrial-like [Hibiscus syriacus]KAE8682409.1 putative ATP binding protein [Hibiscus syriacus]